MQQERAEKKVVSSSSPSSVRYYCDSPTGTDVSDANFSCNPRSGAKSNGLDEYYGRHEAPTHSASHIPVGPYRYRPTSTKPSSKISQDQSYASILESNVDHFYSSCADDYMHAATIPEDCFANHSVYANQLDPPCTFGNDTCAKSLECTLACDQWIDPRKIPATISKLSSTRSRRFIHNNVEEAYSSSSNINANEQSNINGRRDNTANTTNTHLSSTRGLLSSRHQSHDCYRRDHNLVRSNHKVATTIQVSPGEYMRMRGADETWKAIMDDFYMPCTCVGCNLTLFSIQDATFVLCPICRVISPMEGIVYDSYDGGVGLGFTIEELGKWQEEIAVQQNINHRNWSSEKEQSELISFDTVPCLQH
jgi:hypothetical protein